ncbi:hypothetical protein AcV7_004115 [Taiwanofungus camphoratus]|nr:hypothetical protein AcV7_004115 [Antrodia cinnamomea]
MQEDATGHRQCYRSDFPWIGHSDYCPSLVLSPDTHPSTHLPTLVSGPAFDWVTHLLVAPPPVRYYARLSQVTASTTHRPCKIAALGCSALPTHCTLLVTLLAVPDHTKSAPRLLRPSALPRVSQSAEPAAIVRTRPRHASVRASFLRGSDLGADRNLLSVVFTPTPLIAHSSCHITYPLYPNLISYVHAQRPPPPSCMFLA